ncbi:hypothetical protein ABW21_db0209800 [Orbilia brochopaga]|nr:hypothetical protein ABW21_db0209800 [Drechslerella brochopaga]
MGLSKGTYVLYAFEATKQLLYARVESKDDNHVVLQISARGNVSIQVPREEARFQVLPNDRISDAKRRLQCDGKWIKDTLEKAFSMGTVATACAAPGLAGGAATMSGLAQIGGLVGGGAASGIVLLSAAPAVAAGIGLRKCVGRIENDDVTKNTTTVGIVAGGTVGTAAVGGTFVGLSGAGITSTLATLGGGTVATGGYGMAGGLAVCDLEDEYSSFVSRWHGRGYQGP